MEQCIFPWPDPPPPHPCYNRGHNVHGVNPYGYSFDTYSRDSQSWYTGILMFWHINVWLNNLHVYVLYIRCLSYLEILANRTFPGMKSVFPPYLAALCRFGGCHWLWYHYISDQASCDITTSVTRRVVISLHQWPGELWYHYISDQASCDITTSVTRRVVISLHQWPGELWYHYISDQASCDITTSVTRLRRVEA